MEKKKLYILTYDHGGSTQLAVFNKGCMGSDVQGNKVAASEGKLEFRPWEIKTVKIEL